MKLSEKTEKVFNEAVRKTEHLASVGDGATEYVGSDRYAYTIVKVSDKMIDLGGGVKAHKWLDIQEDDIELLSGSVHDGTAVYHYKRGNGEITRCYFHKPSNNYRVGKRALQVNKNGFTFVDTGRTDKEQNIVKVGYREKYRDPHI